MARRRAVDRFSQILLAVWAAIVLLGIGTHVAADATGNPDHLGGLHQHTPGTITLADLHSATCGLFGQLALPDPSIDLNPASLGLPISLVSLVFSAWFPRPPVRPPVTLTA
jgi:hypothetical protein